MLENKKSADTVKFSRLSDKNLVKQLVVNSCHCIGRRLLSDMGLNDEKDFLCLQLRFSLWKTQIVNLVNKDNDDLVTKDGRQYLSCDTKARGPLKTTWTW